jgi:hypothetical protein
MFSRDVLVALKQLSIIEHKRQVSIIKNTFISMKLQEEENAVWEKNSPRIEYETDQIKREFRFNNSKQNLVYVLSFVTLLGLSIYTIKPRKLKTGCFYTKQQQKKPTRIFIF